MRHVVVIGFAAFTLVSCKESDVPKTQPEKQDESGQTEAKQTATADPSQQAPAPRPTPTVAAEPAPSSPFLVGSSPTPSQSATAEALVTNPPRPAPAPAPLNGSTSTNNNGKPCPMGQCFLDGKCLIPGGPIAREGAPAGAVSGVCGGDGGPCSRCRCVSPGTLLSTPRGEIAIEELRSGDLVWSMHQGRVEAVHLLATQRVHVQEHSMARLSLPDGFVVEISGEHPLGDGRHVWDLKPGEKIGNASVESLSVVPYAGSFTYDVLPDSDTGTYFIHGLWLGSTMFGQHVRGDYRESSR